MKFSDRRNKLPLLRFSFMVKLWQALETVVPLTGMAVFFFGMV